MPEIPSSSDYLQMKKWRLLNTVHIPDHNPPHPHLEETSQKKRNLVDIIQKEIFSNKYIVLLNSYSDKFVKGKYNELKLILTLKKVNRVVKHIKKIVPENNNFNISERPLCSKIIQTYLGFKK